MRVSLYRLIGLLLTGGFAFVAAGSTDLVQPPKPPAEPLHLAIQAREILRRRCSECHNTMPQSRAGLNVLDHMELLNHERKLVLPRFPDRSRLLELIEDGSMPQNERARVPEAERQVLRAWIDAGALPFYPTHSESYALARVLDDVRRLEPKDRPYARYLSLHHLLTDRVSRHDLDAYRAALDRMVQLLAKPGEPALAIFEPTETLFRLDLRALGWQEPILTGSKDRGPLQRARLNRFDLLLLDYPYAVLPDDSDDYAAVGREFLEQAQQVRPVPYVRGDWFVSATLPLLGKPAVDEPALERARQFFEKPLDLAAAQAELDWSRSEEELRKVFALPQFEKLAPLAGGGTVPRADWESAFAALALHLRMGTPILPLDSPKWPDYPPKPPFGLKLSAQDPKEKRPKDRFTLKEQMQIVVESEKDVYIELVWTNAEGKDYLVPLKSNLIKAGQTIRIGPEKQPGFTIAAPTGKDRITLLACEASLLADEKDFPAGELFKGPDAARVVHPFYVGWYDPKAPRKPDPARMVKKTIEIEIVK